MGFWRQRLGVHGPISLLRSDTSPPRGDESALRRDDSRARALLRGTFDPAGLLQLGEVKLEATVLGLCLLGLSVLRSHPRLRI